MICELVESSGSLMVEDERRPGAVENEVMEIGWIACRESSICHEGDFEDDTTMDR